MQNGRMEAIVRYLLDSLPGADIALLGLLPRAKPTISSSAAAIEAANAQFRWGA